MKKQVREARDTFIPLCLSGTQPGEVVMEKARVGFRPAEKSGQFRAWVLKGM
jgi:hypothetical protein